MTESLRNMPRYIRNTDAFGWQGADGPGGPWRSITPPQSGTPWQAASPINDLRQASADVSGVQILSPAAYAIIAAAHQQGHTNRLGLAAALRAAAKHTKAHVRDSAPPTDWGQGWVEGVKNAACGLDLIADELEATSQSAGS